MPEGQPTTVGGGEEASLVPARGGGGMAGQGNTSP
jgi:hypothetical protein